MTEALPSDTLAPPWATGQVLAQRWQLGQPMARQARWVCWHATEVGTQRPAVVWQLRATPDEADDARACQAGQRLSALSHPHLLPVLEARQLDGGTQVLLVTDDLPGNSLAERLQQGPRLSARAVVELLLGVVDAVRLAHESGVLHGHIGPDQVLLGADGRARLQAFGLAPWLGYDARGHAVYGDLRRLAPEVARGEAAGVLADVHGLGQLLAEAIVGQPLQPAATLPERLSALPQEALELPFDADVDDHLRGVLHRAMACRPEGRYDSAAQLRDALMQWLEPQADWTPQETGGNSALDFLLRRMRHKSDFPALSDRVLRIQRLASSDTENLQSLADEILQDVALTHKLLRLVNSAHFRRDAQGVHTVSRAVALVGQAGIRNLALSLVLVEHMKDKAHAQRLKEKFLRAVLAGQVAHALSRSTRDAEEAYLAALFYNLGPLLAEFYFPEEAQAVREQSQRLAQQQALRGTAPLPADHLAELAATQVLGLGFAELGQGVAHQWGLPDNLQRCMVRPDGPSPSRAVKVHDERLRWLAFAANEAADAIWQSHGDELTPRLERVAHHHGRALNLGVKDFLQAGEDARMALAQTAPALGLRLGATAGRDAAAGTARPSLVDLPTSAAIARTPAEVLSAGVNDLSAALADGRSSPGQILQMAMETIFRALGCQRVIFCMRDGSGERLLGRFGLGDKAAALAPQFQIALRLPAGQTPDLMAAVCNKGVDMVVPDIRQKQIAALLPPWFTQQVLTQSSVQSLLLLPLALRQAPFGLIYADHPAQMPVSDHDRGLLRTLRNQTVMAFQRPTSS